MMSNAHNRRTFLSDTGMGMTGMALSAMLFKDGVQAAETQDIGPHFEPQAKSVIWIFLIGGSVTWRALTPNPRSTNTPANQSTTHPMQTAS